MEQLNSVSDFLNKATLDVLLIAGFVLRKEIKEIIKQIWRYINERFSNNKKDSSN